MEVAEPLLDGISDRESSSAPIETWRIDTVIAHLCRDPSLASNREWQESFREQHIDGQMLLTLDDNVLREVLHIDSWGIRGKIVASIEQLKQEALEEKVAERMQPGHTPQGPASIDSYAKQERRKKSSGKGMFLDPFRQVKFEYEFCYKFFTTRNVGKQSVMFIIGFFSLVSGICLFTAGGIFFDLIDQGATIIVPFPAWLTARNLIDYFSAASAVGAALTCASVISLLQTSFDYVIDWHRLLNLAYLGLIISKIFQIVKTVQLNGELLLSNAALITQGLLYLSQILFYITVLSVTIAVIRARWEGEQKQPLKNARQVTARAWTLFLVEITTLVASIFYVAGAGYYLDKEAKEDCGTAATEAAFMCMFNNGVFVRMQAQIAIGILGLVAAVVSWFSSAERLLGHLPLAVTLTGYWCLYIADLTNMSELYWNLQERSLPQYVVLESLPNMFVLCILIFLILFGSVKQKMVDDIEEEDGLKDEGRMV